jgi:hypothetical protein
LGAINDGNYDSCGQDGSDKALANNKVAGGSQSAILKRRSTPFAGLFRPAPPCLASSFWLLNSARLVQATVQLKRSADERHMGEGLREVAQVLARRT